QSCVVDQVVQVGETVAIIETDSEAEGEEEADVEPVAEADPQIVGEDVPVEDDPLVESQIPGIDQLNKEVETTIGRFYSPPDKNGHPRLRRPAQGPAGGRNGRSCRTARHARCRPRRADRPRYARSPCDSCIGR